MALVIQTLAASSQYVPYERPPDNVALWTAIPRGLQTFFIDGQVLDLKPINDDFLLSITATIPPNYAYVFNECNWLIAQNRAQDWEDVALLNLQNFYRGTPDLAVALNGNWVNPTAPFATGVSGTTRSLGGGTLNWPTSPMIGAEGTTGIQINFQALNNNNTAAAAGSVQFFISFWQFDLEQVRKHPINAPVPVTIR